MSTPRYATLKQLACLETSATVSMDVAEVKSALSSRVKRNVSVASDRFL